MAREELTFAQSFDHGRGKKIERGKKQCASSRAYSEAEVQTEREAREWLSIPVLVYRLWWRIRMATMLVPRVERQ